MEISPEKYETVAFLGKDAVRYKIIVGNKCLQQVKDFKYFGCEISCENEKNIQQKPAQFAQILRIVNNTLKPPLFKNFDILLTVHLNIFILILTNLMH